MKHHTTDRTNILKREKDMVENIYPDICVYTQTHVQVQRNFNLNYTDSTEVFVLLFGSVSVLLFLESVLFKCSEIIHSTIFVHIYLIRFYF